MHRRAPEHWPLQKGVVSILQESIHAAASHSLHHIELQWEEEAGSQISWQIAVSHSSICIRHGLIQFKVRHRPAADWKNSLSWVGKNCIRSWVWSLTGVICSSLQLEDSWGDFIRCMWHSFWPQPLFIVVPEDLKITANQAVVVSFSTPLNWFSSDGNKTERFIRSGNLSCPAFKNEQISIFSRYYRVSMYGT